MKKQFIGIFVCMLIITSIFCNSIDANSIKNISEESKNTNLESTIKDYQPLLKISENDEISENKVQLTNEQLKNIYDYVNNIENNIRKENVKKVINQLISEDGVFDLDTAISLSQNYYNSVSEMSNIEPFCKICDEPFNESNISPLSGGQTFGTSTVFSAPFVSCSSWGDGTWGLDDWAHSCNQYSGSIGTYASGFIGGATAEAQQQANFYIGETKTISVDAKIIYLGGGSTVGIGAFAGTEKTWWRDNNYGRADIDPWIGWDDIVSIIMDLISLYGYGAPQNIKEAIEIAEFIWDLDSLLTQLYILITAGDAEIHHVTLSFTASPGYHSILAGLRATASGCITGTGVAVAYGAVESITIDGYAPPSTPTVSGPSTGYAGNTFSFYAVSTDPNGDDIQYQFDWGDGNIGDWTYFGESGDPVWATHQYQYGGHYTIKVKAKDRDLLESNNFGTHTITISSSNPNMPTNPIPEDGDTNIQINTDLGWNGGGGNSGIEYKIYFGTSTNPPYYDTIGPYPPSQTTITYSDIPTLNYNTRYYWKIIATNDDISIPGPIWDFITCPEPNNPPNIPTTSSGPTSGYTGIIYSYSTQTIDPDGDMVRYGWDWGDGDPIDWGCWRNSGDLEWRSHKWYYPGTYNIRVKAKDINGAESGFSPELTITIQENQGPSIPIITGPSILDINTTVQFNITATDPSNDDIRFGIDWKYYDDGRNPKYDEWTGFINSGETITVQHTFNVGGYYYIVVVTEDSTGKRSNYIKYFITVNGGNVNLEITDTWTEPNQMIPKQEVSLWFKVQNSGNRDGYGPYGIFFYIDGNRVGNPYIINLCTLIEAGETKTNGNSCNWPNDLNIHEIKFVFGPVVAYLNKSAVENTPPLTPNSPSGPMKIKPNKEYAYFTTTTDSLEHKIYYLFDWGDGNDSGWVGPFESGHIGNAKHKWKCGEHDIKVKAKDEFGLESDWSGTFHIYVEKTKDIKSLLIKFFQNHPYLFLSLQKLLERLEIS